MQAFRWDNFQYVLALHRCETLSGAAAFLGVNETTVSRRLAQTEQYLESRLFTRRSTGWVATETCQRLIMRLERVKGELDEAQAELSESRTRVYGTLRIACEPILMNRMLVPGLSLLLDQYPDLSCELISLNRNSPKSDADVAVCFAADSSAESYESITPPTVVVSPLGRLQLGLFMASGSVANDYVSERNDNGPLRISVDSPETLLSCVRSGLGQCVLPLGVGLRESQLVLVQTHQPPWFRELIQISQPELDGTPRLAACTRWLNDCVQRFVDL
ncbi:MAG: LysR family transcriptional regulator [Granulosicoccus sp.]|nr:LysR family transcriptional regulator [Granulosicoccus sp.]